MDYQQRKRLTLFETYRYGTAIKAQEYGMALRLRREKSDEDMLALALIYSQKVTLFEQTEQLLLDGSALAMCDGMRFTTSVLFDDPDHPLWLQFLAPRTFRGREIVALYFYCPFSLQTFERNSSARRLHPLTRSHALAQLQAQQHEWMLEIITEGEPPEYMRHLAQPGANYLGSAHILGAYNTTSLTWKMTTEHQCQTGTCSRETLGAEEIIIGCPGCLAELEEWSRWLATMLDLLTGKFRKAQGEQDEPEYVREAVTRLTPVQQGNKTVDLTRRVTTSARIVRYDMSYFAPARRGKRGALAETHTILTPEQAAAAQDWDKLQVNKRVLVRDETMVSEHWRYFHASRFKKARTRVRPKRPRGQLITLALWQQREQARAKRRLEELARPTRLITARAYSEEQQASAH